MYRMNSYSYSYSGERVENVPVVLRLEDNELEDDELKDKLVELTIAAELVKDVEPGDVDPLKDELVELVGVELVDDALLELTIVDELLPMVELVDDD